jgi:zinc transporter 1/2/3
LLSITASFSGGLFLSVGLLHLLPEAEEGMAEYHTTNGDSDPQFPYVFLTLILSFSVMMWIEKIAYGSHDHHHHPHHAQVVPALSAE